MPGDPSILIGSIAVVTATLFVKIAEGKHGDCPDRQYWDYHQGRCIPYDCPVSSCPPPVACICPRCAGTTKPTCPTCYYYDTGANRCMPDPVCTNPPPDGVGAWAEPPGSVTPFRVRELV